MTEDKLATRLSPLKNDEKEKGIMSLKIHGSQDLLSIPKASIPY